MPQVNLIPGPQPDNIWYGAQPPQLAYPANLMVMNDKNDRDKGPAYFFQQLYNKVVIVRDTDLLFDDSERRSLRDADVPAGIAERGRGGGFQDEVVQRGTKPWYCFWNGTILEGFIYVNQTNDDPTTTSAPLAAVSTPYGALGSGLSPAFVPPSSTTSAYSPASTTNSQWHKRQATGSPFHNMMKLEERRTPISPRPYCQQFQILNSGQPAPVVSSVQHMLDEDEPMQQNRLIYGRGLQQRRTMDESPSRRARDEVTDPCQCQWRNG